MFISVSVGNNRISGDNHRFLQAYPYDVVMHLHSVKVQLSITTAVDVKITFIVITGAKYHIMYSRPFILSPTVM